MNWITIERYVNTLWRTFIKDKGFTGARKIFLKKDIRTWTIASRLEVLNIIRLLSEREYQIINKFRVARNKFAHGKEVIIEDLSKECLEFTKNLIIKLIGDINSSLLPM